ncbi:MAG: hypothetical protein QXP60_06645 [Nitrososphaerota archaeon]
MIKFYVNNLLKKSSNVFIGIATKDLKIAKKISNELKKRGLKYIFLAPENDFPTYLRVLIYGYRNEFKESSIKNFLFYEDYNSPSKIVDRAYEIAFGREKYSNIIIAIDPGNRIGAAFICDNLIIKTMLFYNIKNLLNEIDSFFKMHFNSRKIVLIGKGAYEIGDKIINAINKKYGKEVELILMREDFSNKNIFNSDNKYISKDERSAISLAKKFLIKI